MLRDMHRFTSRQKLILSLISVLSVLVVVFPVLNARKSDPRGVPVQMKSVWMSTWKQGGLTAFVMLGNRDIKAR